MTQGERHMSGIERKVHVVQVSVNCIDAAIVPV